MEIALYVVSGVFVLFGVGVWLAAVKSRSTGHILGGLCYIGGAISAVILQSWWLLLLGFGLAFIVRHFFGDPHRASSVTSRSKEYKQICSVLGDCSDDFSSDARERRRTCEDRLFALIETDPELKQIFEPKGTDINMLKRVYKTLIYAGAGQWAGTEWVPAASITTPYTLSYLLQNLADKDLASDNPSEEVEVIAWNVLNFFKKGEPLP